MGLEASACRPAGGGGIQIPLAAFVWRPHVFLPGFAGKRSAAAAWLFSVLFLFFFLLLAADVVRALYLLVLFCLRRNRTERFRIIGNRVNVALLVFSAVLATVGMIGGTRVPQVKEETVAVNRLPEEADGLTVAVLADLHVDGITREERIRKIVERTNALNPDIVVIAGDFVDGTVPVHGGDLRPLADLKARYGVFGVPGNHEYYSGYEEWMEFLPTLGIRMLLNEHAPAGGEAVVLAGVTDPVAGIMGKEEPDISKALKDAPERECASLSPTSRGWPGRQLRTAWIFKCPAIRTEA